MNIRVATERDTAFLKSLLAQLGYPGLDDEEVRGKIAHYSQDGYALLVADTGMEVVGFISLHWFDIFHSPGKIGRISAFCVDDRVRGQGIGLALLTEAEDFFKVKGCVKIEVTSNERRTLTHQFYLNRGYVQHSKRFVKTAF